MISNALKIGSFAIATTLGLSGAAYANPTPYTSLASFMAAIQSPATDTFDDVSATDPTAGPLFRTAGAYTYTVSATGNDPFFGAGSGADHWLSTNDATSSIVFGNFSSGVRAVGGFFFGSDVAGLFAPGSVTVTAIDSLGTTVQTIVGATTGSFVGFLSTGALTSLTISSTQQTESFLWPTVNNLVLAQAVPEPEAWTLLLAGLGLIGVVTRRRGSAGPFAPKGA